MAYEEWQHRIQERVNELDIGREFVLAELMQDVWAMICEDEREQTVGLAFSKSVERGDISGVEYAYVRRSPKATVWRRIVEL